MKLTLGDVLSMPEPEISNLTKSFFAHGQEYDITIRADAEQDANLWFRVIGIFGRVISEDAELKFHTPHGDVVEINDPSYLANLNVLSVVSIDPVFTVEEWALFGRKVGPRVIEKIIDWVAEVNGLTSYLMERYEAIKNASSAGDLKN